jgi:hypothetical protein
MAAARAARVRADPLHRDNDRYRDLYSQELPVEPLGKVGWSSWDKSHYAGLRADGHLLLPIQGCAPVDLDPMSGKSVTLPIQANTPGYCASFFGKVEASHSIEHD